MLLAAIKEGREGAFLVLCIVAGAIVFGLLLAWALVIRALLKGGRKEARSIGDLLELKPGKATRSVRVDLQPGVKGLEVLTALSTYLQSRGADLVRQEESAVVLFLGSRLEAFMWGLPKVSQAPMRVLAWIQRESSTVTLHIRLDSDFGAGAGAVYDEYNLAFNRFAPDLEKEMARFRRVTPGPVDAVKLPETLVMEDTQTRLEPRQSAGMALPRPSGSGVGEPVTEFALSLRRRVFLAALGLSAMAAALLILGWALHPANRPPHRTWSMYVGLGVLMFGVLPAGAVLLFNAIKHHSLKVTVGPEGIELVSGNRTQSCQWAEVASFQEDRIRQQGGHWSDALPLIMAFANGVSSCAAPDLP